MSLTVPIRPHRQQADGPRGTGPPATQDVLAFGPVDVRSAVAYLGLWTVVLFVVQVLVLWSSHAALLRLGVLESVSRAVATVLDDPVPEAGVLPALQFGALLPWLLAVAAALALLWLLTLLAVVLVHNRICAVTGGPRVRVH